METSRCSHLRVEQEVNQPGGIYWTSRILRSVNFHSDLSWGRQTAAVRVQRPCLYTRPRVHLRRLQFGYDRDIAIQYSSQRRFYTTLQVCEFIFVAVIWMCESECDWHRLVFSGPTCPIMIQVLWFCARYTRANILNANLCSYEVLVRSRISVKSSIAMTEPPF